MISNADDIGKERGSRERSKEWTALRFRQRYNTNKRMDCLSDCQARSGVNVEGCWIPRREYGAERSDTSIMPMFLVLGLLSCRQGSRGKACQCGRGCPWRWSLQQRAALSSQSRSSAPCAIDFGANGAKKRRPLEIQIFSSLTNHPAWLCPGLRNIN